MANCFCATKIIGAKSDTSPSAMAAYITRGLRVRELTAETFDFTGIEREEMVLAKGLELPDYAPAWARDSDNLWNRCEAAEVNKRTLLRKGVPQLKKKAQTAKTMILNLPRELSKEQLVELSERWIRENFTSKGLPAEWAIHLKTDHPHLHILTSTRRLGPDGFSKLKARDLNPVFATKTFPDRKRRRFVSEQDYQSERWEDFQNAYFEELGLELRVDPRGLVPEIQEGKARHVDESWKSDENEQRRKEALDAARNDPDSVLDALTQRKAIFTQRDLSSLLKKSGLSFDEIEQVVSKILGAPECVRLRTSYGPELYTTRTVRDQEIRIQRLAGKIMVRRDGQASATSQAQAIVSMTLDQEQVEAINVVCGPSRLCAFQGRAGTGKSHTTNAARKAFEADGWRVIGLAPTNSVSRDMAKDGFSEASTIHAELLRQENAQQSTHRWDKNTVVFVDEAAMLDNTLLERLLIQIETSGAKLVLVGDDKQLTSIMRGGMYTEIRRVVDNALIKQVRRQKEDWMRIASMGLADGRIRGAMQAYHEHGSLKFSSSPIQKLLADWKKAVLDDPGKDRFIYAGQNQEVNLLNSECKRTLLEAGLVEHGITYTCKKGELEFEQTIGVGDRLQLNATDKSIHPELINGSFGIVVKAQEDELQVRLDSGKDLTFDPRLFNGFALGYAGTIYKGQGKTQMDVYALYSQLWNRRSTYVGCTRHKGAFNIYVDEGRVKSFEQLVRGMSRGQKNCASIIFAEEENIKCNIISGEKGHILLSRFVFEDLDAKNHSDVATKLDKNTNSIKPSKANPSNIRRFGSLSR